MTTAFFARSAWKTFVRTKCLPFAVEGLLMAVMTPSLLTVVVYGSLSTIAGGTKVPSTTQAGAGHVRTARTTTPGPAARSEETEDDGARENLRLGHFEIEKGDHRAAPNIVDAVTK